MSNRDAPMETETGDSQVDPQVSIQERRWLRSFVSQWKSWGFILNIREFPVKDFRGVRD